MSFCRDVQLPSQKTSHVHNSSAAGQKESDCRCLTSVRLQIEIGDVEGEGSRSRRYASTLITSAGRGTVC